MEKRTLDIRRRGASPGVLVRVATPPEMSISSEALGSLSRAVTESGPSPPFSPPDRPTFRSHVFSCARCPSSDSRQTVFFGDLDGEREHTQLSSVGRASERGWRTSAQCRGSSERRFTRESPLAATTGFPPPPREAQKRTGWDGQMFNSCRSTRCKCASGEWMAVAPGAAAGGSANE